MPPEVATPGNEQACQDDDKDRGEARAERGPVNIDQQEAIVGLVETNVAGFVRLVAFHVEGRVIGHLDGWAQCRQTWYSLNVMCQKVSLQFLYQNCLRNFIQPSAKS